MSALVTLAVGIAWPLLLLFAVVYFRAELKDLLNRVLRLGPGGAEFAPPQAAVPVKAGDLGPVAESNKQTPAHSPIDRIAPIYRPFVNQMVERTKSAVQTIEAQQGWRREEILTFAVAEFSASLHLERATRNIFGSQLTAMEFLKNQQSPLTKESFRSFYTQGSASFPQIYQNYSFEQWFGFLVAMELVAVSSEGIVTITEPGKLAAHYVAERGYMRPFG